MASSRLRLLLPFAALGCAALALLPATGNAKPASVPLAGPALTHRSGQALAPRAGAALGDRAVTFGRGRIGGTAKAKPADARHGYNVNGGNWSGAAATGSGFSSVSASWTEPYVTCNSTNDLMAPWVGIDGYGSSTVEQTGVATDCSYGYPIYQGWYEMYPAGPVYYSNPVGAGDQINASVTRSGSTYTLTLTDASQGWTQTVYQALGAANASAEVIIESPTASYPNFGSVNFFNATIDGAQLGAYNPVLMDASNNYGYEDHTSGVNGGNFSIQYLQE